jgi:hypothetical protein
MRSVRARYDWTKICSFILLFCFSVYATSPLTAILDNKNNDTLEGKTANFSIFAVHYVFSGILTPDSGTPDGEQDDPPGDHCLIKKKRAALSLKNFKKILSLNVIAIVSPESLSFTDSDAVQSAGSFSLKYSQFLPLPLYLGNPPPFA